MSNHHNLKTLPQYFIASKHGLKPFEVRKNDRDFKIGDILHLQEFTPPNTYSGREITRIVTYVLDDSKYCKDGYVILGVKEV